MRRALLALALLAAGVVAARRLLGGGEEAAQSYSAQPDQLPNEPDRPVTATPPPGA